MPKTPLNSLNAVLNSKLDKSCRATLISVLEVEISLIQKLEFGSGLDKINFLKKLYFTFTLPLLKPCSLASASGSRYTTLVVPVLGSKLSPILYLLTL